MEIYVAWDRFNGKEIVDLQVTSEGVHVALEFSPAEAQEVIDKLTVEVARFSVPAE